MAASKISTDIIWYWYHMQQYKQALTPVKKRYVLQVDMPRFLKDCEHPRVKQLMTDYIAKEVKNLPF